MTFHYVSNGAKDGRAMPFIRDIESHTNGLAAFRRACDPNPK
jgi:hypothetical protein